MSYQVIARKWRPQKFADVAGQEHITRTLQNAILQDRVGHAYLFIGPRGTGKTTTARIFAKALNCQNRAEGAEPCCECTSCREIAGGQSLDVIEIDGASHNKVEHARDLIGTVQYTPTGGRFKVYIIDEVHMLTDQAWNALLKTLEEPPPHVKFLFATTEPHKILPTILSRCQRLDLKRISAGVIAGRLRWIAGQEQIAIEDAAINAIARAADGGMRDAQSIFDQMIAFCGGRDAGAPISEADIMDVFGLASGTELLEITRALLANDLPRLIPLVQSLADRGRDLEQLHKDLVLFLRDIMIVQVHPQPEQILEGAEAGLETLRGLAGAAGRDVIQRLLEGLMGQETFIRYAVNKRIALEVALIRVLRDAHSVSLDEILQRLGQWKAQGGFVPMPPPAPAASVPAPVPAALPPPPVAAPRPPVTAPAAPVPPPPPAVRPAPAAAAAAPEKVAVPRAPAAAPVVPPPPPAAPVPPPVDAAVETAPEPDAAMQDDQDDLPPWREEGRRESAAPAVAPAGEDAAAPTPAPVPEPPPRAKAETAAAPAKEEKPRLTSSPEVWARVEQDPFVQKVCTRFQAKIVDVRG